MRRFLLAAALAFAGCTSDSGQKPEDRSRPEDRFDVTRPGARFLDGALVVTRMAMPGKDEPCTYFDAELENRGTAPLSLEIRTVWKDGSDAALAAGPWQPIEIPVGGKKTLSDETESCPTARYVKLEVRARP